MRHREVTDAVHDEGGAIALQVLHAGRYGYHPFSVSASAQKSPITPFRPRALSTSGGRPHGRPTSRAAAALARKAGYDARRDHGLRGLPDQPVPRRAHQRPHRRVGRHAPRSGCASPLEIVRRTRELVGDGLPIVYRISLLDLVEDGQTWDEIVELAHASSRPPA